MLVFADTLRKVVPAFVKKLIVFASEHGIAQVFCINRPAADFGEVPTQAVFAKDTKSRLFTKRVLKKEHSNTNVL